MKASWAGLCASLALLAGCGDKSSSNGTTNAPGSSALNAPADYVGIVVEAPNRAHKVVDTASLNQAVQMFRVEEGRNPKSLEELVEQKLIPRIPDPPRGMKFVYDEKSGSVSAVPVK